VLTKQSQDRLAQVEKLDFNYGKLMGRYALVLTELDRSYVKQFGDVGKIEETDTTNTSKGGAGGRRRDRNSAKPDEKRTPKSGLNKSEVEE
jgi:hypothetical protein